MALPIQDSRRESDDVLEALRHRAIRALQLGYQGVDVATILGVARETVSRWWSAFQSEGAEALPGPRTGRPVGTGRWLDEEQAAHIQDLLDNNTPEKLEIPSALWTRRAVRELIKKETGLDLPIRTVGEYLLRWGYTPQKPFRKSRKQVPEKVQEWLEKTYPAIVKQAADEGGDGFSKF